MGCTCCVIDGQVVKPAMIMSMHIEKSAWSIVGVM